jgi:hypothetical protein
MEVAMSRIKNFLRNINYLTKHSLWDQREEDIVYLTDKIVDDMSYEYDLDYYGKKHLSILTDEQSLTLLEKTGDSFIRTSDGEVNLMMGNDHAFLNYNKEVADILISALEQPKNNLMVAINRNYFIPLPHGGKSDYYRRHAYTFRQFYLAHCNENITYLASGITGGSSYDDRDLQKAHFDRWRNLFKDRDIVIVCGKGILDSLEYDVFELAKSKEFIYGPKTNAWDVHDELMEKILAMPKDKLIVFILGQSGKAMNVQLTDLGYTCWDVGHLAKYYNAFMTRMVWDAENTAKFFAPD